MNLSVHKTFQKGFTLIELLVVIGILGILAAALVATIDPFEQIRKGEDARTQNLVVEYQTALIRYYTSHLEMPWEGIGDDQACAPNGAGAYDIVLGTTLVDATTCTNVLIAEGELKQAFTTAPGLKDVFLIEPYIITGGGQAEQSSPAVCYMPVSKSGKLNDNARYTKSGEVNDLDCPSDDPLDECYWCAE